MHIICTQENLLSSVNLVSHIASRAITLPILNNILLKSENGLLTLSATDLELGVHCIVRSKVEADGAFTVQAKVFANIISLLPKENVDIRLNGSTLHLECGGTKTKINGLEAADFPIIPGLNMRNGVKVEGAVFKQGLGQVLTAVSQDENRPELTGVLFRFQGTNLVLVATDSYRLAERKMPTLGVEGDGLANNSQVIVPTRTVRELLRTLDESKIGQVAIYVEEGQILFLYNDVRLVSRLIEGSYPDYEPIIPEDFQTTIEVNRQEFLRATKAAGIFTTTGVNAVDLQIILEPLQVQVSSLNSQVGENLTTLKLLSAQGSDNKIVFDFRYLSDGLNTINSEGVTLGINGPTSLGLLRSPGHEDYLYVIMPIRP